jgi:hypothetical protein
VKSWNNISAFADAHWGISSATPLQSEFQFADENISPAVLDWLRLEFPKTDRPKTLILVSPSRYGKTEWSRSLGKAAYMEGDFDLGQISEDSEYLVMSDIPRHKIGDQWVFEKYKAFFGAQKLVTVTDKYRKKVTLKWGKPMIYLCNKFDGQWAEDDWLMANSVVVHLDKPMF